jgi:hypothetical protein
MESSITSLVKFEVKENLLQLCIMQNKRNISQWRTITIISYVYV